MTNRPAGIPEDAEEASIGGFNKYVGPLYRLSDLEEGAIKRFAFAVAEKHMNGSGTIHGGMLMTFMDVSMSRTTRIVSGAKGCSTVSLTCDFVGPGRLGDIMESRVRVTRRTRTMVFLSAEIVSGDRIVMIGTGLWKIAVEA